MSNRVLNLTTIILCLCISAALLRVAYNTNMWRDFIISEALVITSSVWLWFLLRNREETK